MMSIFIAKFLLNHEAFFVERRNTFSVPPEFARFSDAPLHQRRGSSMDDALNLIASPFTDTIWMELIKNK